MLKKQMSLLLSVMLILSLLAGCSGQTAAPDAAPETTQAAEAVTAPSETAEATQAPEEAEEVPATQPEPETAPALPDGVYTAIFDTDSGMFHVNETLDKKGVLTVRDGVMTIHVTLAGKGILNLFPGSAEDAEKEGAALLEPSEDEVTYPDGMTETAYGFDIPVPCLDAEFDCALIGKKGTWYDHKVSVSQPRRIAPEAQSDVTAEVTMTGGSGRASIQSPAPIVTDEDGQNWAIIVWSSPNYEYMLVDGVQYDPIQEGGNSTFLIPIVMDEDMSVSALTVAMSSPHLIDYVLHFDSASIR